VKRGVRGADWGFLAIVPAEAQLPKNWEPHTVHNFEQLRYEHLLRKLRQETRFNQKVLMSLRFAIEDHQFDLFEQHYGYKDINEYLERFPCIFDQI
jgi:hypothetical protein